MISTTQYIDYLYENKEFPKYSPWKKAGSVAIAGLTGTVGGPFGLINAAIHTNDLENIDREKHFRRTGERLSPFEPMNTGRTIGRTLLGFVPVIGSVNNIGLALTKWNEIKKLEQTPEKAKEIAKEFKLKIVDKKTAKK